MIVVVVLALLIVSVPVPVALSFALAAFVAVTVNAAAPAAAKLVVVTVNVTLGQFGVPPVQLIELELRFPEAPLGKPVTVRFTVMADPLPFVVTVML